MSSTQRIQQRGATSRIPRRSAILGTTCLFALAPFALALMFAGNTHAQKPVHVWQPSGNSGFVQTLPDEWTAEGHVGSVEFGEPETNPFAPQYTTGSASANSGGVAPEPSTIILSAVAGLGILHMSLRRRSNLGA